jgi:hypothetical protein
MSCDFVKSLWANYPYDPKPIDWTKPVRHNSSKYPARLLGQLKGSNHSIIALENGGRETINQYTDSEVLAFFENTPPKKIVKYVNLYKDGSAGCSSSSRREADELAEYDYRVACIRVELEEGRFDG